MKLLKNSAILLALATVLVFSSCAKYEEGPSMSLLTKTQRLTGEWVVSKVLVDGTELTGDEMEIYNYMTMTFEKDGTGVMHMDAYQMTFGDMTIDVPETNMDIEWQFSDDKTELQTRSKKMDDQGNYTEEWDEWVSSTILKLENKEMWTTDTSNGVTTEMHMEKK